jgi:hypothetical protein
VLLKRVLQGRTESRGIVLAANARPRVPSVYEEEDTCHMSYEEEDTCHMTYGQCSATSAQRVWGGGYMSYVIWDMYNNDVGKESAQNLWSKQAPLRPPPFILLHKLHSHILPPYWHRYCTYRLQSLHPQRRQTNTPQAY